MEDHLREYIGKGCMIRAAILRRDHGKRLGEERCTKHIFNLEVLRTSPVGTYRHSLLFYRLRTVHNRAAYPEKQLWRNAPPRKPK